MNGLGGLKKRTFPRSRRGMNPRYWLKRMQYLAMRHVAPLTPAQVQAWRRGPRVYANSIPKAGTNLLKRLLNLLPCVVSAWTYHLDDWIPGTEAQLDSVKRGQVVTAHAPWSRELAERLRAGDFRTFLMIRDLRDVAVSNAFYIASRDRTHRLHSYFQSLPSDEERLMASIAGIPGTLLPDGIRSKSWGEHAAGFLPWLDEPDCLVVRFEDLIGSSGGGSDEKQIETVRSVVEHLGIELTEAEVVRIAAQTFFPGARTFRQGRIGAWRDHFHDEHKRVFKETAGQALIRMGYERDFDW